MLFRIFFMLTLCCLSPTWALPGSPKPVTKSNQRAYNFIMTERKFGDFTHNYALLGFEIASNSWNLLGGKKDPKDKTRGIAAARELYEESCMILDKRNDAIYWYWLPFYEFGSHKVFIHPPGYLPISCGELNEAAIKAINNKNLPHDFKEMVRYQLIKVVDLVNLALAQTQDGSPGYYNHPREINAMKIDGWLLYTLKHDGVGILQPYMY